MKKLASTLCIAGLALGLAACETTGSGDTSEYTTPYNDSRTATHSDVAVKKVSPVKAERTFRKMQTK